MKINVDLHQGLALEQLFLPYISSSLFCSRSHLIQSCIIFIYFHGLYLIWSELFLDFHYVSL